MSALRLLHITDTHLVGDANGSQRGVAVLDALRAVLARVRQSTIDAVLLTGDVVHDDPAGYEWIRGEFAADGCPVLCIPGNHDEPQAMRKTLAGAPFRHGGVHDFEAWRIVMLDSCLPGHVEGLLREAELAQLDTALATAENRHVLVVLHHHPVEIGSRWLEPIGLVNTVEFMSIVDRHANARGILWGHVHQVFEGTRRNAHGELRLMASPSTCVQFAPGAVDFTLDTKPPGCRLLYLHEDGRLDTEILWVD